MNFWIYVQRLVRYYIDGLMCTAHLLPLLCLLLFIINARNINLLNTNEPKKLFFKS